MTSRQRAAHTTSSLGDSAVDGLLSGTSAGLLMAVYITVAGVLAGQVWTTILAQFDPSATPSALTGILAHLAVSGVYGVFFGMAWRWLGRLWPRVPSWLVGLAYGLVLWTVALLLLRLPAAATPAGWLAGVAPVHLALAHALYGLALGGLLGRRTPAA